MSDRADKIHLAMEKLRTHGYLGAAMGEVLDAFEVEGKPAETEQRAYMAQCATMGIVDAHGGGRTSAAIGLMNRVNAGWGFTLPTPQPRDGTHRVHILPNGCDIDATLGVGDSQHLGHAIIYALFRAMIREERIAAVTRSDAARPDGAVISA